jgi:hypothetical protein
MTVSGTSPRAAANPDDVPALKSTGMWFDPNVVVLRERVVAARAEDGGSHRDRSCPRCAPGLPGKAATVQLGPAQPDPVRHEVAPPPQRTATAAPAVAAAVANPQGHVAATPTVANRVAPALASTATGHPLVDRVRAHVRRDKVATVHPEMPPGRKARDVLPVDVLRVDVHQGVAATARETAEPSAPSGKQLP